MIESIGLDLVVIKDTESCYRIRYDSKDYLLVRFVLAAGEVWRLFGWAEVEYIELGAFDSKKESLEELEWI